MNIFIASKAKQSMRRDCFVVATLLLAMTSMCYATEKQVEAPVAAPVSPVAPAAKEASEKAKSWKGLEAQEQWVTRLNKQISGETSQLSEMRAALAQKYKLELKTLEAGGYAYDEEKDEFVER